MYQDIIKNVNDEYEDERYTNLSAAMVHLEPKTNVSLLTIGFCLTSFVI